MSDLNDKNTVASVSQAHDRVSSMLSHFSYKDATWEEFGKRENYLEQLKMDLAMLARCVEAHLQESYQTHEPQELGT